MHQHFTSPFLAYLCFSQFSHSNCIVSERIADSNPSQKQTFYFMIWSCRLQFSLSRVRVVSMLAAVVDGHYRDDQLICIDGFWPGSGPASGYRWGAWHLSLASDESHGPPEMIYKLTVTRDTVGFYFCDIWTSQWARDLNAPYDSPLQFPAPRGLILSHWPSSLSQSEWRG